jgi:hypothetical protein
MRRHSIFLRAAGGLVWTARVTIARIFLIAGASAFGRRCAPANKRSAGKVPLAPIAGDFAIDLPPAGGCYFRSGPDTLAEMTILVSNHTHSTIFPLVNTLYWCQRKS